MNREEYKQLLIDKGYGEDVINELLEEYDINLGKITGATTVGANAAPDMTAPDTDLTSEISLSDYPSLETSVKLRDDKINDRTGIITTSEKTVPSDFYKEFTNTLNKGVVDKYFKNKTREEMLELDENVLLDDVFNQIQSKYIANDPFIKAKRKQFEASIQPEISKLKDKYSKLAKQSATSELAFENEAKLAELDKQFQEEYSQLY